MHLPLFALPATINKCKAVLCFMVVGLAREFSAWENGKLGGPSCLEARAWWLPGTRPWKPPGWAKGVPRTKCHLAFTVQSMRGGLPRLIPLLSWHMGWTWLTMGCSNLLCCLSRALKPLLGHLLRHQH